MKVYFTFSPNHNHVTEKKHLHPYVTYSLLSEIKDFGRSLDDYRAYKFIHIQIKAINTMCFLLRLGFTHHRCTNYICECLKI